MIELYTKWVADLAEHMSIEACPGIQYFKYLSNILTYEMQNGTHQDDSNAGSVEYQVIQELTA